MTSKITIELDFDNGQPYIKLAIDPKSDDVRDKLVKFFTERFQHTSSWCSIKFTGYENNDQGGGKQFYRIDPITPTQLPEEAAAMTKQVQLNEMAPPQAAVQH